MKNLAMIVVMLASLSFAEAKPAFIDKRGLKDWRAHESRVNRAIAMGAVGEVEGEMPDPEDIRDSLGTGRIAKYENLFSRRKDLSLIHI